MAYALSEDVVIPLGTALAEGRLEPFPYREDVSVGLLVWVFARWGCCWCLLAATSDALALSLNCQMGDLEDDLRLAFTVGRTPFWDGVATLFGHSIDYDMTLIRFISTASVLKRRAGNMNHSTMFLYSVSASISVVFFHNGKEFNFRRLSFPLLFSWGSPIIFILELRRKVFRPRFVYLGVSQTWRGAVE